MFPRANHAECFNKELQENANTLNWDGVQLPPQESDIITFEDNNNVSICIYAWKDDKVITQRHSEKH